MAKNQSKLSEITFIEHLNMVREKKKSIENYLEDTDLFLHEYLAPVLNKIDLRREKLKQEANKKIDDAYFKIINEIENIKSSFKQKTNSIDNKKFEELAVCDKLNENSQKNEYFNDKLNKLKRFEEDFINSTSNMIENFKSIDFKYAKTVPKLDNRGFYNHTVINQELGEWNDKNFCFGKIKYKNQT
ncbi:unnamed protein product [Brachionus calyciflorus]|uniref:Uncharacterized protein n=1 Tax=Brachionus calyciflorus TaxID=104777 RepID=A0A813XAM8_9BILA|nr:unnamed protein product [Brachionus calyciflorus]